MKSERISGIIQRGHKADAVEVPFDPGARWGVAALKIAAGRRGYPVACHSGATRFDSHIVARSKKFWLLLPPEIEQRLSVETGETVTLSIKPA